jgi:APA family basic amino acid/polyamine antiporter
MTASAAPAAPRQTLSVFDGVAFLIGMVIGVGIFKAPQLVAMFAGNTWAFVAVWIVGGLVTLIGALCYAELGSAYPNAGGEYHFLSRAYGRAVSVLFAWARGTVIQTGAIAAVAFVYGEYASTLVPLGANGVAIHAASAVVLFSLINLMGTMQGKVAQHIFTVLDVAAIALLIVAGLLVGSLSGLTTPPPAASDGSGISWGGIGLAMVFVLLTYGGWNEAAYLSGEMRDVQRNLARTLIFSIGFVVIVYTVVNLAYLSALGLDGLAKSNVPAAAVMRMAFGDTGALILTLFICGAALSTLNATIFTGGRVYFALGRDLAGLGGLGVWSARGENPANAFLLQGAIALALVLLGSFNRNGFQTMVDYTAPVFWFFMLLVALALFVLRWREPEQPRPYRVPLYPLTPILFVLTCTYMLHSSIAYTGYGALFGVGVLVVGLPLLLLGNAKSSAQAVE